MTIDIPTMAATVESQESTLRSANERDARLALVAVGNQPDVTSTSLQIYDTSASGWCIRSQTCLSGALPFKGACLKSNIEMKLFVVDPSMTNTTDADRMSTQQVLANSPHVLEQLSRHAAGGSKAGSSGGPALSGITVNGVCISGPATAVDTRSNRCASIAATIIICA